MTHQMRSYSWGDPHALSKAGQELSGLEFMRLLATEKLGRTPMMATLAFRFTAVEEGRIEFECETGAFMYNPMGVVHGGLAATLLDSAASCAVHTTLPAGTGATTLDLTVHLLRPILSDLGPIREVGTVVSRGRRTALGSAEVRDGSDRLLAQATATCVLLPTPTKGSRHDQQCSS
jgi:uncharacterized protein (TIGR00369 family)